MTRGQKRRGRPRKIRNETDEHSKLRSAVGQSDVNDNQMDSVKHSNSFVQKPIQKKARGRGRGRGRGRKSRHSKRNFTYYTNSPLITILKGFLEFEYYMRNQYLNGLN